MRTLSIAFPRVLKYTDSPTPKHRADKSGQMNAKCGGNNGKMTILNATSTLAASSAEKLQNKNIWRVLTV